MMGVFEGKTPAERNKIIAAIVLGVLATASLIYTFGPSFFGSSKTPVTTTASSTPTPEADATPAETRPITRLPAQSEIDSEYASIPISYSGSSAFSVPVTGRNIFAFWEPGDPTPVPVRTPPPPTPIVVRTATPFDYKVFLSFVTPQSMFAGSKSFRLEVNGDKFRPDSRIVFNGTPLQTTFVSEQRLYANVRQDMIASPFTGSIMVETPGTEFYSRQIAFTVQDPPRPEFEYIGMIARQHYNNDTAYFQEKGARSGDPFSARLNDVIKGRFRVISISEKEVEFQDTNLGFKHKLPLLRPKPGTASSSGTDSGYGDDPDPVTAIPGIPSNIRRVTPRRRPTRTNPTIPNPNANQKVDSDDTKDQD